MLGPVRVKELQFQGRRNPLVKLIGCCLWHIRILWIIFLIQISFRTNSISFQVNFYLFNLFSLEACLLIFALDVMKSRCLEMGKRRDQSVLLDLVLISLFFSFFFLRKYHFFLPASNRICSWKHYILPWIQHVNIKGNSLITNLLGILMLWNINKVTINIKIGSCRYVFTVK